MSDYSEEIQAGQRFAFGANWERFLHLLDVDRIAQAESSLKRMLGVDTLHGKTFLDVGSGSGLFSLTARRLGAKVHSFDYDVQSVACTAELRRRYFPADVNWTTERGDVLSDSYLASLGSFDVVYAWGVLHHTGNLRQALSNIAPLVAPEGKLFIAIYNDQRWVSRYWTAVKRIYQRGGLFRAGIVLFHTPYLIGARWMARALTGRLRVDRGMSLWHDMIDWLGGYPFEVATPQAIISFYQNKGYRLLKAQTVGHRHGCNEFVFEKQ